MTFLLVLMNFKITKFSKSIGKCYNDAMTQHLIAYALTEFNAFLVCINCITVNYHSSLSQMDTNVPVTYALWGNCFIYVYSVADRSSFHEINRIKREVDELRAQSQPNNQPDCVSVLVGNQSDLHHQRTVSQAEGRALADQWGCRHCELSASDGNRMDDVINMYHGVYLLHHQQHWLHKHRHRLPKLSTLPLQRFRKAIQKVIVGTRLIRGHNSNHIITDTWCSVWVDLEHNLISKMICFIFLPGRTLRYVRVQVSLSP